MQIFYGILALIAIIFIHESGHVFMSVINGIKVKKFSIFFGKAIFTVRTKYIEELCVGWIPLGGYVKLDEEGMKLSSWLRRISIYMGGILFNLLSAIIIYLYLGNTFFSSVVIPLATTFLGFPLLIYTFVFQHAAVSVNEMGGPATVVKMLVGLEGFAFISWNIALFNFLPLYPLDGGLITIEALNRILPKKYAPMIIKGYVYLGIALIAALMFFAISIDIVKYL